MKKYLTIGQNLTYTHRYSRALGNGNIYGNVIHDILDASPLINLHSDTTVDGYGRAKQNPDGSQAVPDKEQDNPMAVMHYYYNYTSAQCCT